MSAPTKEAGFVAGNHYDKYRTKNPIYRRLVEGFLADARSLVERALSELPRPARVLEVGCGPGDLAARLFEDQSVRYVGIDLGPEEVAAAKERCPGFEFRVASAESLPFDEGSFDFVVACEVLEHLEDPRRALAEMARVGGPRLLASVPWEPVWRAMNMARGAYLADLGNTPGHLQHFSRRAFRDLVSERYAILEERRPFPWSMLLAAPR